MGWSPPQLLVQDSLTAAARAKPSEQRPSSTSASTLTYAELYDRALRFARVLQDSGLERGDRVALYLDNTATCATAIFGTLLAGGVFVVVNPQTKAEKLAYVLADSEAAVLVVEERTVSPHATAGAETRRPRSDVCSGRARSGARRGRAGRQRPADDPERPRRADLHLGNDRRPEGRDDDPSGARLLRRQHRHVPAARRATIGS